MSVATQPSPGRSAEPPPGSCSGRSRGLFAALSLEPVALSRLMKVLVADQFEQSGLDGLRAAGCDVVYDPALKDEALAAALGETQRARCSSSGRRR